MASEYVWGVFKKIASGELFLASGPLLSVLGRIPLSPTGTIFRADMVWTDAMLAVLRWQVQHPPTRRPGATGASPRAPQTTAPLQNVVQNRGLREILLKQIVRSESRNMSHTENAFSRDTINSEKAFSLSHY